MDVKMDLIPEAKTPGSFFNYQDSRIKCDRRRLFRNHEFNIVHSQQAMLWILRLHDGLTREGYKQFLQTSG